MADHIKTILELSEPRIKLAVKNLIEFINVRSSLLTLNREISLYSDNKCASCSESLIYLIISNSALKIKMIDGIGNLVFREIYKQIFEIINQYLVAN